MTKSEAINGRMSELKVPNIPETVAAATLARDNGWILIVDRRNPDSQMIVALPPKFNHLPWTPEQLSEEEFDIEDIKGWFNELSTDDEESEEQ